MTGDAAASGDVAGSRPDTRGDTRRTAIEQSAIEEFSAHGIRRASMARIAAGAGVSRPALYQYFDNKDAIFAAAFVSLFNHHADLAIEALERETDATEQLDGFLQRFAGDLWERMAGSPHADEIEQAKTGDVAQAVIDVFMRVERAVARHLAGLAPGGSAAARGRREEWSELLRLAPKGLRSDQPAVSVYRARLRALARTIAADIEN